MVETTSAIAHPSTWIVPADRLDFQYRFTVVLSGCRLSEAATGTETIDLFLNRDGATMYLPKVYEKFKDQFPDVFDNYKQLGIATRKAGPLDQKTQDLIKLGIAVGANSRGGVMSNIRKAKAAGAGDDEIYQTILLGLTTAGFPNMIAALTWAEEVLCESR
jgi:alkylhydroperoxidase/carboxymuconolactone decarboxylase family protein YurZ